MHSPLLTPVAEVTTALEDRRRTGGGEWTSLPRPFPRWLWEDKVALSLRRKVTIRAVFVLHMTPLPVGVGAL